MSYLNPTPARHCLPRTMTFFMSGRRLLPALAALLALGAQAAGTWTTLTNPNVPSGQHPMLLSDGTVIFLGQPCSRLTPDIHGSYVNGTWSSLAPMHDSRTFYSSQVLRDGRVFVSGGEYGSGANLAEMYDPAGNVWTQLPNPPDTVIDNISETLPNGNILEGSPGSDTRIFDVVSNVWSAQITSLGGQDEASWVKLQDGSILTFTGTNSARFVPALNQWVADASLPAPLYGYGYELGHGLLLPNGRAIYFGGTGTNAVYTPWTTNAAGIYTPNGATNAGTWSVVAPTPNFNAAIDAPAAMLVNGKILCCMTATNNGFGSASRFYEYDYVANSFTAINGPGGGLIGNYIAYGTEMLDLPDGTVLVTGQGGLCVYSPGGTPLTNGMPTVLSATTNLDGSFHVTGTLFNGISEGAGYGDDWQMNTDFPVARLTNSAGSTLYARTYNWSTCNLMTGTNVVTTEMTLPAGLLAGTYPLVITANGISSAPYSLAITGTPLPPVTGLVFSAVASNRMAFYWSPLGLTEAGYVIQRSTDGATYVTVTNYSSSTTNYTDNAVAPLGQYYYRVRGTNAVGLGIASSAIFAASPPVVPVPAPWSAQDVGVVLGRGASGSNAGAFTVIGSGGGIGQAADQFQSVFQPVAGDVTITARVTASQNTSANALAGVMIRNGLDTGSAGALMAFGGGGSNTVFQSRAGDGAVASGSSGAGGLAAPVWVRLVRSGNSLTGYTSPDGTAWTQSGTAAVVMEPVVYAGLAVGSGATNLINTSTFDNVTISGTAAAGPLPLAEWKLDETGGATAADSRSGYNGTYNSVLLGQPGATPDSGFSAGFNGTSADIAIPPLNLNSNILTLTAWVNRNGSQSAWSGIFFNRANATVSGLHFGTANELRYTWNGSASTYNWNSGLTVPNNQWTFVALVIEPARARIFMATNGVLASATNSVANAVQAFDGTSYLGQDSTGGRFFNGLLDEVQFYNQALTPAQLGQLASPPAITFSSPANGAGFLAPANVNVTATLSATNGHAINLVQFYSNGTLVGQSAAAPYTNTLASLAAGSYVLSARLYYDSGLALSSDPVNVIVQNAAAVPQNVAAVAEAGNLVNVSWSSAANAGGYILSRSGTPIAQLAGTSYADFGLSAGSNYCYSVVATNLVSSSASSASSCVTTPGAGGALVWDANGSVSGPQDGSGGWDSTSTTWWNGSADAAWAGGSFAVFGVSTTTNCTVTLLNDVTPSGIVFNATGGGNYTLAGTNNILLAANLTIAADGNAAIYCPLSGATNFTKTGTGSLVLSNSSPSLNGLAFINAGTLELPTGPSATQIGYVIGTNGILHHGYNTSSGYTKGIVIYGGGVNSGSGLYIALGTTLSEQNFTISNAPTTITSYGSGANAQMQSFDINGDNLLVRSAASGSVIDPTVNLNVAGGYGIRINVESGASNAAGDLSVNGLVVGGGNALRKYGAGSLRLSGANSYSAGTIVNAGSLQLAGSQTPLGSGPVNYTGSGILQAVVGTSIGNSFSINSGLTLTVDTLTNLLTLSGAVTNSGKLTKIGSGTLALAGANTYTGATSVGAGTLQVDGSLGATAITVSNTAALAGVGVITTAPALLSGSTLTPGDGGLGALTVNSALTLAAGTKTLMEISRQSGVLSNDLVAVTGTLTLGGTLTVTNIGPDPLAAGDSFDLFNAGTFSGGFGSVTLPALGVGLKWYTNNLAVNGTISVSNITYTLTYAAGANGSISGASPQTVNYGTSGSAVTAVPNTGYHFVNWSDSSVANPRTDANVTNNLTVTANFAINTYTLTYNAGTNGTISGTTPQTVNYGANGSAVTAVPNSGYSFVNWSDGSTANPRTDSGVTNDLTVVANFAASTFTLTYNAGPNGTVSGTSPQTVNYGGSGSAVTALPNSGYGFTNWSDGSAANPRTDSSVTNNLTVTANFVSVTNGPLVWSGGGADANWSTAANWNWALPANGQALTFQGALQANNTNDFLTAAGPVLFNNDGFTLSGQPVVLTGGLLNAAGNNRWNIGSTLGNAQGFVSSNGTLTVSGSVTNGGYALTLDGPGSNVISGVVSGTGGLVKNGGGVATVTGATFTGNVAVNAGALEVLGKSGDVVYAVAAGAVLRIGYSTGGGYANTAMTINGSGAGSASGLYLLGGKNYNSSGQIQLLTAPTTLRQYGSGLAGLGTFDINGNGLRCTAAASGSAIDANIQMISEGYGMSMQIDAGANTATGDLAINGPLNVGSLGFYKRGTGSLVLNGPATAGNTALKVQAGAVICGAVNCLGTNAAVPVSSGATLALNGFNQAVASLNAAAGSTVVFGGTNTLTVSNAPALAGTLAMAISKGGSTGWSSLVVLSGTLTNGGSLTVTNLGGTLAAGDSFSLFNAGAYSGGFTNVTLPALATGLVWNTSQLGVNGSIRVDAVTYTLTYNAGANGSISGSTPQTVNYGTSGSAVTAVPNTGYHFVNWSDSSVANPRTDSSVTNDLTVTANFAINTYTLTYNAGANGSLSGTSPQTVTYGASGSAMTAVPNTGCHFVNWSDGATANPRTDSGVTNDLTVTANFAINTYTLTYSAGANGSISGVSPQTVNYGTSGSAVTAVPNTGYHFVNWSDSSVANPRTDASVTNNLTVTANFAINTYTLTYNAGTNGTVSGTTPQTVNYGTSGSAVTAVPNTGYHFVSWSDSSVANPRTDANVTNNLTVTANFAINTYTLTYSAGTNGSLSGTSPQTVNYNASGSAVTAVPDTGYHFVNWSDAGVANPRTDANVTGDLSVTANFALNTVTGQTITWDADLGTSGAQDGSGAWVTAGINWQSAGNNVAWTDGNAAVFGVDTTTNCTVTLGNNVAPAGITFNAAGGGNYTIAGTNSIMLTNSVVIAAGGSPAISALINGSGTLVASGAPGGALTLSTPNGYTGGTVVNGGRLISTVSCWYTPRAIGSGLLTVSNGAVAQFTQTHGFGADASGRSAVITDGTLQFDHENYVSALTMTGGSVMGAGEIRTVSATYNFNPGTSNTLVGCGINLVSSSTFNVSKGAGPVDLLASGYVTGAGNLTKSGAGLMQYTGASTGSGTTTVSGGTLQVDGTLGTNTLTIASGATLAGTGTVKGATTVQSGGTLAPGSAALGTLSISNSLTLAAGSTNAFGINKTGTTLTGDLVKGLTGVTYGGTLTVTATGNALAAGDSFTLFSGAGYAGSFAAINLPVLATGLVWNTSQLGVNGSIRVDAVTYTLTYNAGANGSISGSTPQTVNYGTSGSAVTAVPNTGYHFVNWSDSSVANPRTDANVTNDLTVTANFAINTYTLTYNAGANGSISGPTPQTVNYGASGSAVTAVANTNYHFLSWSDGNASNPRTDAGVTSNLTVTANFTSGLPTPWKTNKVGSITAALTANYSVKTFTLAGAGAGLAAKSDSFWLVDMPVTNSFTITALVTSQQTNGTAPLAGVMVRPNTVTNNVFAFMGLSPTNVSKWITRGTSNANSSTTIFANMKAPYWVRLVRSTNTFTGYVSSNGVAWTQAASLNITMATNALAGLVVCSGASGTLNTSVFDNVTVTNNSGVLFQPRLAPALLMASAQMESFNVGGGTANFAISGDDGSRWQLEESDDLVTWTPAETVTLIGGSVQQAQGDDARPARFFRLVQVP